MTDIVVRLLRFAEIERPYGPLPDLLEEAAAEIARLREGLLDCMQEAAHHHRQNEARAKIGGSDIAKRKAKAIVARSGVLLHNIQCVARAALNDRNLIEKDPASPPGQSTTGRKT